MVKSTAHARRRAAERGGSVDAYGAVEMTRRGPRIRYNGKKLCMNKTGTVVTTLIDSSLTTFIAPDCTEKHVSTKVLDKKVAEQHDICVNVQPTQKLPREEYQSKVPQKKWRTLEPYSPSLRRKKKDLTLADCRNFNIKYV